MHTFFKIQNKVYILIDLNFIFSMKPSELKISTSVESYDEKTAEKIEISTLPKNAYFPNNQRYLFKIMKAQVEDLNEDFYEILRPHLLYFLRNKPSKSVTLGPGRAGLVHRFK